MYTDCTDRTLISSQKRKSVNVEYIFRYNSLPSSQSSWSKSCKGTCWIWSLLEWDRVDETENMDHRKGFSACWQSYCSRNPLLSLLWSLLNGIGKVGVRTTAYLVLCKTLGCYTWAEEISLDSSHLEMLQLEGKYLSNFIGGEVLSLT